MSYCKVWGPIFESSWSACFGLFYPVFECMDSVVAAAYSHSACGLFIYPRDTICDGHRLLKVSSGIGPDNISWYELLEKHTLLWFSIFKDSICTQQEVSPFIGCFAAFNFMGKLKSKRRPEKHFDIRPMSLPMFSSISKISLLPFCPTRSSPLVGHVSDKAPLPNNDIIAPSAPPLSISNILPSSPKTPNMWNVALFYSIC